MMMMMIIARKVEINMEEKIIKLYLDGKKINEISKICNCDRHKVSKILTENNIKIGRYENLKGKTFTNKDGHKYEIIESFSKKGCGRCLIKFSNTGYITTVSSSNAKRGSVKDYYERTIYGVACKGDIICRNNSFEQICFHRWCSMISRCYNVKDIGYHSYGGRGVKVCDKWLIFKNFYNDLTKITGFDKQKYINHEIELDKDLSGFGREYSLEKCQFINNRENRKYQRRRIKPFKIIFPDGKEEFFETQTDCANKFGLTARTIGKCLHKQLKSHKGCKFEYILKEE